MAVDEDHKPSVSFDDGPIQGADDPLGGPDVAFGDAREGAGEGPAASGFPAPRKLNMDLARDVEIGKLGICDVLNIPERDARSGKLDDRAVRAQVDDFFRIAGKLGGAQRKAIADSFRQYTAFAQRLTEIQKAPRPAEALLRAAEQEAHQRGMERLVIQAGYALEDWSLDWSEHEQMLAAAKQLGLTEADVESAYAAAATEIQRTKGPRGGTFIRRSRPPPPQHGWKPLRALREGGPELWQLADLQQAMLRHFQRAVTACAADEEQGGSLVGYLEGQLNSPDQEKASRAARTALSLVTDRNKDFSPALGPWVFLWSTGVPDLHFSSALQPEPSARVRTLTELFEHVRHPAEFDKLAPMLSAGLLSSWLRIVAKHEGAAQVADAARREERSCLNSLAPAVLWRGVLETLWTAGMSAFPVVSRAGQAVRSVRELVSVIDEAGAAPEIVDRAITTGAMKTWLSRVDPSATETLERVKGPLPGLTWAWLNGGRSLAVSPGGAIVGSLRELLEITDGGDAALTDDVIDSTALETWCELVLRDPKLAASARELRSSGRAQKAELWRQGAGARELRIGAADASTPAAFAALSLEVHRGRDVSWEDIAGALAAGLPQRRFRQMAPELVEQFDGLAAAPIPAEHKGLLACIVAKQRTLPLSAPGLSLELGSLAEALAAIHQPGFRDKVGELIPTFVFSTWLQWFAPDAESVAHAARWAQLCREHPDRQTRRVAVDAMLRWTAKDPRCFISPRFSPSTLEELRAGLQWRENIIALQDPEVRDRIRDALGWGGGMKMGGALGDAAGPLEEQLRQLPPHVAAHLFAWTWLSHPVLWLSESVVVASRQALLELLALPEGWATVRAASVDPLFPLWLREGLRVGVPEVLSEGGGFDDGAFARLVMWLGDVPAAPTIAVDASPLRAGMGEGGVRIAECTVINVDSFRTLDIVVSCSASDGVTVDLDGASARTLCLEPGQQARLMVRVESKSGTGAGNRWMEITASPSASPTPPSAGVEPAQVASERVSFRVGFPGGKVAAWGVVGTLGGLLLGAGYAAVTRDVLAGTGALVALERGRTGAPSSEALLLGAAFALAAFVVFRVLVGVKLRRVLPRAEHLGPSMTIGGLGLLCLAPLVGCCGCIQGKAVGCVGGFGGGLGAGLLVGVLAFFRPGATRPRGEPAVALDVLYWCMAGGGLLGAMPLALLFVSLRDAFDAYSVMAAQAFWLDAGSLTESAARGTVLTAGALGLAAGLRRGLFSALRPAAAIGAFVATTAAFAIFVHLRQSGAVSGALASRAECAQAVAHVIDTLSADDGSPEAYRSSPTYPRERDRAVELCVSRGVTTAQTSCLGRARTPSELGDCDAFWVDPGNR